MATNPSDAYDRPDSSFGNEIPGLSEETTPFSETARHTAENIKSLQKFVQSSEPHIMQELIHSVERNSRALASEHERSKTFMEMVVQLTDMYKKVEDDRKALEDDIHELMEQNRSKDLLIQELESRLVVQETEISRLDTQLSQVTKISHDSTLLIEIKDYSQKKSAAISGPASFYTDEFYTDRHGYKMCARIYLNGDGVGKGTHLSIFFALKKGAYDNYLKWPFRRRVNFILINQDPLKEDIKDAFRPDATSSSFQKPTKDMNIASGCPMFVSHKVLENPRGGFIKNNTICLKVVVEPS